MSTSERVMELLNSAVLSNNDAKITMLKQVQELIINKDPTLLNNFLDVIIAFQADKSVETRMFVVNSIEEACKLDNRLLMKLMANLHMLLEDENAHIVKKSILTMIQLYKVSLKWVARSHAPSEHQESFWDLVTEMAVEILLMLESDNDGIRTHAVKFVENLIITLSPRTSDSEVPKIKEGDISLEQIPQDHPYLKSNHLQYFGKQALKDMLTFMAHPAISSINLIAALGSLVSIARQRPMFMAEVIQAYKTLHVNLPPTLSITQVRSIQKNMKLQLLCVLRYPSSCDYQAPISTLLMDLGSSQAEIARNMPPPRDSSHKRTMDNGDGGHKKSQADVTPVEYTPMESTGTDDQIRHLARLMATQMTADGIGPGVEQVKDGNQEVVAEMVEKIEGPFIKRCVSNIYQGQPISMVAVSSTSVREENHALLAKSWSEPIMPGNQLRTTGIGSLKKIFNLKEVSQPLNETQMKYFKLGAVRQILQAEKSVGSTESPQMRVKVLARLATDLDLPLKAEVLAHILGDPCGRLDLALAWLYQEYCEYQSGAGEAGYHECLTGLLTGLHQSSDQQDGVFTKVVLETRLLTNAALDVVRKYCEDEDRSYLGMSTLSDLILTRPARQFQYLHLLLDLSSHEKDKVRQQSLLFIKRMYEKDSLRQYIEKFAVNYLQLLVHPNPPPVLFGADKDTEVAAPWTDNTVIQCLYLYLALLPQNHKLIHELASVYTEATTDIKRNVLRVIETPIRSMGINCPELLLLVESCPKGAETLVTRCLHILTDKVPPSPELVKRVRDLYQKRLHDIRFLIPVLNGLDKKEVIHVLPELIKLNLTAVKEVFNRLLRTQHGAFKPSLSSLSPVDLLVSLHIMDSSKCDMKSVIKATNVCFSARSVYTSEVLVVVLQQLVDTTPLPMLLMRTVIQVLGMYPRMEGFIMKILARLIYKQVWKYPMVWEGFIRCCQRTKPQSFSVLLQLPPPQLLSIQQTSPDLRDSLLAHVQAFTPYQLAHVPHSIVNILEAESRKDAESEEAAAVEKPEAPAQDIIACRLVEKRSIKRKVLEEQKVRSSQEVEEVIEIFIEEEEEAMNCKKRKVRKILEQPQSSSTQFLVLEEPKNKTAEQTEI